MPVNKSPDGRRSISIEVEVPGSPEEVWQSIATGPGISSWFTPTELEERAGGRIVFHLGDVDTSIGNVTAWEPPHRLAYEEPNWSPPAPPLATEHIVDTRAGGTCIVRIVSSLFTDSAEWDDQIEQMEFGWRPFFEILRLMLTHFPGQTAIMAQQMHATNMDHSDAWSAIATPLGLVGAQDGSRVSTGGNGLPSFAGVIDRNESRGELHSALLLLNKPLPGIAAITTHGAGEQSYVSVGLYLFGDGAAAVAEREEPKWKAFLREVAPPAE